MKIALGVAVAAVLVLSGCVGAPQAGNDTKTPAPIVTVTPTPTPTPTEVATSRVPLAELVLSPTGLGPIVVGEAMPAFAPDTELATWSDDFCGGGDSYGNWTTYFPLTPDGKWPFLAEVTYFDGTPASPIEHISVQSTEIHTIDGIVIGSKVAEVKAAYGADLKTSKGNDGYLPYWVEGPVGSLVFWIEASDPTHVYLMEVVGNHKPPVFSFHVSACA